MSDEWTFETHNKVVELIGVQGRIESLLTSIAESLHKIANPLLQVHLDGHVSKVGIESLAVEPNEGWQKAFTDCHEPCGTDYEDAKTKCPCDEYKKKNVEPGAE